MQEALQALRSSKHAGLASVARKRLTKRSIASRDQRKKTRYKDEEINNATCPRKKFKDIVRPTNLLSCEEFAAQYVPPTILASSSLPITSLQDCQIELSFAQDLSAAQLAAYFELIESTSRQDYNASTMGWHPKQKKKEMLQREMRYLSAWEPRSASTAMNGEGLSKLRGFLSFMITHEAGSAVLYIYEIHLADEARGHGLGRRFMQIAETIAQNIGPGIEKVMLTCFTSNVVAQRFYSKLGYDKDESSPQIRQTRGKTIEPDYVILSKRTGD